MDGEWRFFHAQIPARCRYSSLMPPRPAPWSLINNPFVPVPHNPAHEDNQEGQVRMQSIHQTGFANRVISYDPGTGFAVEYGTGLGYTLETSALGRPSDQTSFGAVQPFNPAFDRNEIVSIGESGHLTVQFLDPILNQPDNPFGLDFIIYGNTGFIDFQWPDGIADPAGSTFGNNSGMTRVSVSADNLEYFTLDVSLAPTVDDLYPTDGTGLFGLPVNPSLSGPDFANLSLAEIRELYKGSAGGTGYDLSWARDDSGQAVMLDQVSYVRVDVLSGATEIDGLATVMVPEPATWMILLIGLPVLAWTRRFRRSQGKGHAL